MQTTVPPILKPSRPDGSSNLPPPTFFYIQTLFLCTVDQAILNPAACWAIGQPSAAHLGLLKLRHQRGQCKTSLAFGVMIRALLISLHLCRSVQISCVGVPMAAPDSSFACVWWFQAAACNGHDSALKEAANAHPDAAFVSHIIKCNH